MHGCPPRRTSIIVFGCHQVSSTSRVCTCICICVIWMCYKPCGDWESNFQFYLGLSSTNNIIMTQNYTNTNTCTSLWRYCTTNLGVSKSIRLCHHFCSPNLPMMFVQCPHMTHKGVYIYFRLETTYLCSNLITQNLCHGYNSEPISHVYI